MLLCGLTDKDLRRICRSQYEHPGSAIGYWPETCLGHVYIVLEPVGSACLTLRWQFHYEFIYFDVPKVVRSPGCDHGHDKESRNGRDIKIDILDDYIWTSEWFRVRSGIYRSTGRLLEPPRHSKKYSNHSEPFRCPNIVVQYIDRYVSTILRLLFMSPISSGTPNSFGTSILINS